MRKVLITGSHGFIGTNFAKYLHAKYPDYKISLFDALTYAGHIDNYLDTPKSDNLIFYKGNICDERLVKYVMKDVDVVVHFAAESHVDRSNIDPEIFRKTNVLGTHVILREASRAKTKLVHIVSTDEVFGSLPINQKELKFNEDSPHNPTSPYAKSKSVAEKRARWYHKRFGVSVTISNCSNNYGMWQDPEKLIPRFITNLLTDQKLPLMGNGENIRDWIHVLDHCRAIDMIIHRALIDKSIIGEAFCVGGDSERTNLEVTQALLKISGKDESWIERMPHRLNHDERYAIDNSKIEEVIGWKPEIPFETGLEDMFEWYVNNRSWWEPLKKNRPNIDPEIQMAKSRERNG